MTDLSLEEPELTYEPEFNLPMDLPSVADIPLPPLDDLSPESDLGLYSALH